jgi:prephenate dehydratase
MHTKTDKPLFPAEGSSSSTAATAASATTTASAATGSGVTGASSGASSGAPRYPHLTASATVSIQGQPGSFHHIGARMLFGDTNFLYRNSFREVFDDARAGRANFIFIAIENSIAGSIIYNYDLLAASKLPIVAEKYLRIGQHFIGKPGTPIDSIREVWSHPMAIEQCRVFLQTLDVKILEKEDTAGSVRDLRDSERRDVAVISSDLSAQLYGMEILRPHIETDPGNYTRFLLLSREILPDVVPGEQKKTTVYFGVPHRPGGLVTLLQAFHDKQVNITKIESRPRVGSPWVYDFFADVHLNAHTSDGQAILEYVREYCEFIHVLGSYPDLSEPDLV